MSCRNSIRLNLLKYDSITNLNDQLMVRGWLSSKWLSGQHVCLTLAVGLAKVLVLQGFLQVLQFPSTVQRDASFVMRWIGTSDSVPPSLCLVFPKIGFRSPVVKSEHRQTQHLSCSAACEHVR